MRFFSRFMETSRESWKSPSDGTPIIPVAPLTSFSARLVSTRLTVQDPSSLSARGYPLTLLLWRGACMVWRLTSFTAFWSVGIFCTWMDAGRQIPLLKRYVRTYYLAKEGHKNRHVSQHTHHLDLFPFSYILLLRNCEIVGVCHVYTCISMFFCFSRRASNDKIGKWPVHTFHPKYVAQRNFHSFGELSESFDSCTLVHLEAFDGRGLEVFLIPVSRVPGFSGVSCSPWTPENRRKNRAVRKARPSKGFW